MMTLTDEEIDAQIESRQIPSSIQGLYRRALLGSRPAAVKVMCLECQGYDHGARQAITDCSARGCPLWAVRPYVVREKKVRRAKPKAVGEAPA